MKRRFIEDSWRKEPWFRQLCQALKAQRTEEDMANLLRDLGTLSEIQTWSERLETARLLARGLSYRQVSRATGLSTTTITRVAHVLENGEGGYRKVLHSHRHHRIQPGWGSNSFIPIISEEKKVQKPPSILERYLKK